MWRIRFAYWRGADPAAARRPLSDRHPPPPRDAADLRQESGSRAGEDASRGCDRRRRGGRDSTRASSSAPSPRRPRRGPPASSIESSSGALPTPTRRPSPHGAIATASSCERSPATTSERRMRHALAFGARRADPRAILIGTDCPALDVAYLARAVAALDDHAAVFGPAEDGGYVLVGLARRDRRVFRHSVELGGYDGCDPSETGRAASALAGAADALGCRFARRSRALAGNGAIADRRSAGHGAVTEARRASLPELPLARRHDTAHHRRASGPSMQATIRPP